MGPENGRGRRGGDALSTPVTGTANNLQRAGDNPRDWRELWRPALHLAVMRSKTRRERVLKYPDLAELLTRPEIGYARPDQWTGYVPPEMWNGDRNDHPRRAALVAIATEAMARENRSLEPAEP